MYYSQDKQDEFLEKNIFKGYKNGIFIDVGAFDGKTINNTLYFEKNNNFVNFSHNSINTFIGCLPLFNTTPQPIAGFE